MKVSVRVLGGLALVAGMSVASAGAQQGYGGPPPPPQQGGYQQGPGGPGGPGGPPPFQPHGPWQQGMDTLRVNQALHRGDSLFSKDGRFQLDFQQDGNVVLKHTRDGRPIWDTGTSRSPADRLVMQADGNAVLYTRDGRAIWDTGVTGPNMRHGQVLIIQNDGNLVVYSRGQVYWASGTDRRRGPNGYPPQGWNR